MTNRPVSLERSKPFAGLRSALLLFLLWITCFPPLCGYDLTEKDRHTLYSVALWGGLDAASYGMKHVFADPLTKSQRERLYDDKLLFLDQWAVNTPNSHLDELSDYTLYALCAAGGYLTLREKEGWFSRSLELSEGMLMQSTLANFAKVLAQRPRPYAYDRATSDTEAQKEDAVNSFYSGHTSAAFCLATMVYRQYEQEYGENWWLAGSLYGMAGGVGALRVASAQHFPTDVLVGAAAGTVVGWWNTSPDSRWRFTAPRRLHGISVSYRY